MNIFSIIMCLSIAMVLILAVIVLIGQKYDKKYIAAMWICNIIYWTAMAIKNII